MCGIYGITKKNLDWIENYINLCAHRGPDANNTYIDDDISLGHNLLSITDTPNNGIQPWKSPKGNILVYNGEIFNYFELCKKHQNFKPKTNCDTELLAWGLDEYGIDFIEEIDSMHAFAFWQKENKKLFLSRDHAGIKPLYYSNLGSFIAFGSEAKGLLETIPYARTIDQLALSSWSYCGLNVTRNSFFKGINKVMPGETLLYNLTNKKITSVKKNIVIGGNSKNFLPEQFIEIFDKTIKNFLIGTREIGIFLSGGLDSTIITHHATKYRNLKVFTSKIVPSPDDPFEDFNSDYLEAKSFSKKYNLKQIIVQHTPEIYSDYWYSSVLALEEPLYNPSIPMYEQANKMMKDNGIVVSLSGDMGDELLYGYPSYDRLDNFQIKTHRDCIKFWLNERLSQPPNIKGVKFTRDEIIDSLMESVFPDSLWDKDDIVSSYMRLDQQGLCPEDFFRRNDRFGMKYSIEGRFPFASKVLMNYLMNIHSKFKRGKNENGLKFIIKNSYKNILSNSIINKTKTGWTAPIHEWKRQFNVRCSKIYEIANNVTLNNKLVIPDDKRWAPFLHFYSWIYLNKMKL